MKAATTHHLVRRAIPALLFIGFAGLPIVSLTGPAVAAEPTCEGLMATMVGTSGDDALTGTSGDDVIAALDGDDVVDGGAGNDVICGDGGADVIGGGSGADRLFGGLDDTDQDVRLAGDSLTGGPGDDHLDPGYDPSGHPNRDDLRWGDSQRGVTIDLRDGVSGIATGIGRDTLVLVGGPVIVGSRYADTVKGSPLRDRIHAGRGADTIYAGAGDDEMQVDADRNDAQSSDLVQAGAGDDTVVSFTGHDRVFLGQGRDQFSGYGAQNAEVHGQGGSDFISVRIGTDRALQLRGDQGADYVTLWTFFRTEPLRTIVVDAGAGRLRVLGRPGLVGVVAGFENYELSENAQWDFRGTSGPDHVQAFDAYNVRLTAHTYGGNDYVVGGGYADFIDAGAGRDRVLGGDGRDTCLHAERRTSCEVTR